VTDDSPSGLRGILQFMRERAHEAGMSEEVANDLGIAVAEACWNAVLHASSPDVRVTWHESDEYVEVMVQDRGVFQNRVPMPELGMGDGFGIPLMRALVDEVTIREGTSERPGTLVTLVKAK
jgi:anti-sigma regulatory factor (Ser/Thr protein kinase)